VIFLRYKFNILHRFHIHVCVCVFVCVCIYIYIYIECFMKQLTCEDDSYFNKTRSLKKLCCSMWHQCYKWWHWHDNTWHLCSNIVMVQKVTLPCQHVASVFTYTHTHTPMVANSDTDMAACDVALKNSDTTKAACDICVYAHRHWCVLSHAASFNIQAKQMQLHASTKIRDI
jgi:hypothetical protein